MKNMIIKILAIVMCMTVAFVFASCESSEKTQGTGTDTVTFTDSCGRSVEIPAEITRVAPAGAVAQMVLMTVNPDVLVGLANEVDDNQKEIFPEEMQKLPVFGQFYGSNPNLNKEAVLAADPQIIIDVGDMKETQKADMDSIQEQTGIPTIFVETSLDSFPEAYRTLGRLLGNEERGDKLAEYVENTVSTAKAKAAGITDARTVYYGGGPDGLGCNPQGSVQADVIEVIGAENAVVVDELNHQAGGNLISLETLYNIQPDVIIVNDEGSYDRVVSESGWTELKAVRNEEVYEIPGSPYCWMSAPPSVNRILGIWWLGNLVYPEIYDYDMTEKTIEYFKLFFNYEMSTEQAEKLLENSSLKLQ